MRNNSSVLKNSESEKIGCKLKKPLLKINTDEKFLPPIEIFNFNLKEKKYIPNFIFSPQLNRSISFP